MNAYELADELQETEPYYSTDYKLFDKAAAMLRQQADRVGVLEASHKIQVDIVNKQNEYIELLEQSLRASLDLNKVQAARQESSYLQNVKKAAAAREEG